MSFFAALAVSTLVKTTSSDPLLQLTVKDYLWGYDDPLISLASTVVPTIIPFKKLGLLDRMFDDGVNIVTINLPERVKKIREMEKLSEKDMKKTLNEKILDSDDSLLNDVISKSSKESKKDETSKTYSPLIRDYSIDMWNGSPGLHHWGWTNDKYDAPTK